MTDAPKNDSAESKEKNSSTKEQPSTQPVTRHELHIPQSLIDEYRAHKAEEKCRERCKFWVAVSTLIVISLYTYFTFQQARQMGKATDAAQRSADAAKSAAETAAKQLEMAGRPWVLAQVSLDGPPTFGEKGGSIRVAAILKNVGHSPALNVRFVSKVIAMVSSEDVYKRQAEFCEFWKKRPSTAGLPGNTIFPGEQYRYSELTGMPKDEVETGLQKAIQGGYPGRIHAVLICCVDYQFTFASEHHQTRYARPLGIPQPSGTWEPFIPRGTPEGVVLIPSMFGEVAN